MAKSGESVYVSVETLGVDKAASAMKELTGPISDVSRAITELLKSQKGFEQAQASTDKALAQTQSALAKAQNTYSKTVTNVKNVQQNLRVTNTSITQFISQATPLGGILGKIGGMLTGPAGLVAGFTALGAAAYKTAVETSKAYQVQWQAEENLLNALDANQISGNLAAWKDWASGIQAATTTGDEAALKLASLAARFASSEDAVKSATQAAIDFSAATGKDAESAIKSIGAAITGRVDGLKELGIYLDATEKKQLQAMSSEERETEILKLLNAQYSGMAERMAALPTQQVEQISNLWGDAKENIGEIVSAPLAVLFEDAKAVVSEIVSWTAGWVKNTGIIDKITIHVHNALLGIKTVGSFLWNVTKIISGMLEQVEGRVLKIAMDLQGELIGAINKIVLKINDLVQKIPLLPDGIKSGFASAATAVTDFYTKANNAGKKLAEGVIEDGNRKIQEGLDAIKAIPSEVEKSVVRAQSAIEKVRSAQSHSGRKVTPSGGGESSAAAPSSSSGSPSSPTMPTKEETQAALITYQDYLNQRADLINASNQAVALYEKSLQSAGITDQKMQDELLKAYKLQQQQDLQQQLAQAGQTYRQQEQNAELASYSLVMDQKWQMEQDLQTKKQQAEEAWRAAEQEYLNSTLTNALQSVGTGFADMFTSAIDGTVDMRQATFEMFKSLAKNIFSSSISQIVSSMVGWAAKAGESQAGIPVVGPILAAAASAAVLATMGAMKAKAGKEAKIQYATGGYVSSGLVRGAGGSGDSVQALLQPGERVLSKEETKAYDSSRVQQSQVVNNINVYITGGFDKNTIQREVRQYLIPEINRALGQGYSLKPA